jgi:periplasmic divalent cation tolerance protein
VSEHVRVETTVDSAEAAASLAGRAVEDRLVACAQVAGPIASTYRWEGSVTTDQEWLVVMKTATDRLDELVERLLAVHPYEVPEIVATPVVGGNPEYLDWVTGETRR